MNYNANSVQEYLSKLPKDRKTVIERFRKVIKQNLPIKSYSSRFD